MKIIKFFVKIVLTAFLLIVILWAIVLGILQTKKGQDFAFNYFKSYVQRNLQTEIEVGKVNFSFPLTLNLEKVSISQENLPITTIQNLEVCCAYMELLQGKLVFSNLKASDIQILGLPRSIPSSNTSADSWELLLLPFYIKFTDIDFQNIRIGPEIIKTLALKNDFITNLSFDMHGMVSNNPFKQSLTAHLQFNTQNDQSQIPFFNLAVNTQNHQLSFSLHSMQTPLHIFFSDLPPALHGDLALYASASLIAWQNFSNHNDPNNDSINGHFKLFLNPLQTESSLLTQLTDQTTLQSHYSLNSLGRIELVDFKIDNPNLSMEGAAVITANSEIDHGNFTGAIKNFEYFNSLLGQDLEGTLTFDLLANGPLLSPILALNIESPQLLFKQKTFQNIRSRIQTYLKNEKFNGLLELSFDHQNLPWKIETTFDWNEMKRFSLSNLQIHGMNSLIKGNLQYDFTEFILEGKLEAEISDLQDVSSFLTSPVSGKSKLKIELTKEINAHASNKQKVQIECLGSNILWNDWKADQLFLKVDIDPFEDSTEVYRLQSFLESDHLIWQDYSIKHLIVHSTNQLDSLHTDINQFEANWNAENVLWKTGSVGRSKGKMYLGNPLKSYDGSLDFTNYKLLTNGVNLEELTGNTIIQLSQENWPFQLSGKGIWKEDFIFKTGGTWHYKPDGLEVSLHQLKGKFGPYPLELMQPISFLKSTNRTEIAGLHFRWGEAEIQANFNLDEQNLSAQLKTNAIPSELFHYISPNIPVKGHATFQGNLEGSVQQPNGQFFVNLHDIQITDEVLAQRPLINGKASLKLSKNKIHLQSDLHGIGRTPVVVSGTLPIEFSLNPFKFNIDSHLPFNLLVNAEGDLDPYMQLINTDATNLSGQAKIAIILTGQINAPQIQGHIDLKEGSFESISTGALYHHIQAHLEGNGNKINLTQFSAKDNKNGSITAEGAMTMDPGNHFPFEFHIHPNQMHVLDSDYAAITAGGTLSLLGNSKQSKLQGKLIIDHALVRLEEALPKQIKSVDITYINQPDHEENSHYSTKEDKHFNIELDVKLLARENVMIQGDHLKSEWKGAIAVTGTSEKLQFNGDLRVAKGEYDFNGKIFNLSQGTIHFGGPLDKKTTLYIVASREIDNIRGDNRKTISTIGNKDFDRIRTEIIVKGPANKPQISFRSNPPLSQREVLSYILFNRGISDISSNEGDQLSQSFISLNASEKTKGNDNFLSRLRNNYLFDHLDFTSTDRENKDFGVQVGKNITKNVTVSAKNQSMTSLSPAVAVEAKLRKNFKVQAETGFIQDAPIRMSIKWKKDY